MQGLGNLSSSLIEGKALVKMFSSQRYLWLVILQVFLLLMNPRNAQSQCVPDDQRVPFRLLPAKLDSDHPCADPSSITDNVEMVEFPEVAALRGVKFVVISKDYKSRTLRLCDAGDCLPELYLRLYNSSIDPFKFESSQKTSTVITFYNCSSSGSKYLNDDGPPSFRQDLHVCPVYVLGPTEGILEEGVTFCTKILRLESPLDQYDFRVRRFTFRWSRPKCDDENSKKILFKYVLPASGSILLMLFIVFLLLIYSYFKTKGDDHARLEKFLKDYEALKPTRFSYADLKRITNHFKDKIGEGAHGSVFKGKLSNQITVAVKVLNNSDDDGKDFINEVGTMGKIHHINVVRLLGFCAEGFHRALVYDFFPNGSLQNFISSPDNKETFLGWLKLQQIALGIAKGIEYLHHDCDYQILHFDINPDNVLLDHNFTPKISDFGLAKLCSKTQSAVSITAAKGTLGYIAPEVFSKNFGNVSYKSDIYSYGMLLLEMVGGRKNTHTTSQEAFQILYPKWVYNLIEGEDINIHIEDEDDNKVARKLAIVGLWCIQWHPISRPSMKTVIQMLHGEGGELKVPPIQSDSINSISTRNNIPSRPLNVGLGLEIIHELE